MPSWPNNNELSDDDEYMDEYNNMQMEYFVSQLTQTPDTVIDPSFCGLVVESDRKCILHRQSLGRFVAFGGTHTRRRFIRCATMDGVNCGVLEWVDAPWPVILQRCLTKLWDMYHEENLSRVQDKEAYGIEVAKLKELDSLGNQYSQLVDNVSKLFDY
ncbi:unnamed protein product [Triticum aestivum]|uniref:Uncharacterized protein n=1 Tax=Triticum aestivum TaxID=4565 RepID=A0A7H4LDD2_WHEAT|nr:unnamed protein product [Triticum aestivum]